MDDTSLRQELLDYINTASEDNLRALFKAIPPDSISSGHTYTDEEVEELESYAKECMEGKVEMYTFEEVCEHARTSYKNKKSSV